MSDTLLVTIFIASIAAALGLGWLTATLRAHKTTARLMASNAELTATLAHERSNALERVAALEKTRTEFSNTFAALASQALQHNSGEFLKLAQENLKQFHIQAQGDLTQKERSIENFLTPIKEALAKTEQQIQLMEKDRKEAYGSISRHLETMALTQQQLQRETSSLVNALRRPEIRGQWGEMTLKRLAELAGMVEHCDFYQQEQTITEGGTQRPDMIVRMPGRRAVVVDVKTPLDAYLSAIEASDDASRVKFLEKHAQNVRSRVRELAAKSYWSQFQESPDFVVLFIPGDQFLSAALDLDRTLLEDALTQKVILATPTSLVALLRAVAYGWQQEQLTENAEKIRQIGGELYQRLAVFSSHFAKIGKNLASTTDNYNRAVGSFERQIMPGARKFNEMGIRTKNSIETLDPLENIPRTLEQIEEIEESLDKS